MHLHGSFAKLHRLATRVGHSAAVSSSLLLVGVYGCSLSSPPRSYVWPARHYASSSTDPARPPMGARLRLKASFDVSSYPPQARVILQALKGGLCAPPPHITLQHTPTPHSSCARAQCVHA